MPELSSKKVFCFFSLSSQGCTLFFYETDGRSGIDNNSTPKHAIWVESSIVQAVPEHPKKDFVFCLSNSLGDAFLFQVRKEQKKKSSNVIWPLNEFPVTLPFIPIPISPSTDRHTETCCLTVDPSPSPVCPSPCRPAARRSWRTGSRPSTRRAPPPWPGSTTGRTQCASSGPRSRSWSRRSTWTRR